MSTSSSPSARFSASECSRGASVEICQEVRVVYAPNLHKRVYIFVCASVCFCGCARAWRRAQRIVTVWQYKRSTRAGSGCSPKALLSLSFTYSQLFHYRRCESCGRPNYLSPRERLYMRFRWAGARRKDSHVAASHSFIRLQTPPLIRPVVYDFGINLAWRVANTVREIAIA